MDEQLNLAPFGYLVIDRTNRIIEMNQAMREMAGTERTPVHVHDLLTVASRVYFQTYFMPSITLHGKVNEMFLTLKSADGPVPVLMNAAERNGFFECAMIGMTVRDEYEKELLLAKREAERINRETADAFAKLKALLSEVECKQGELEELNESLYQLAALDPLTGLKNRRSLETLLEELTGKAEGGMELALLAVDIDFFKRVNDTYGHQMGDAVLQELAWKLEAEIGDRGVVARLGGEEFVIVLPQKGQEAAVELAEGVRRGLEKAEWLNVSITVSIGVAAFMPGDDPATLFERADKALYEAKSAGRNRVAAG